MARNHTNPDRRGVPEKVKALTETIQLAEGRTEDELIAEARNVVGHTDKRLAFSGDITVVALAGATGSGKSSTFNALSGTQLAVPGVTRPTTSKAMAAYWGDEVPNDLLDWLQVPTRHVVSGGDKALQGLVLLDLPDHDSTERAHRDEVDRLVQLVDMFIWVVDPQKYADAALHDRYLKPLAQHAEVMMVVLNQADRLPEGQLEPTMRDLRALLDSEGLGKAQVCAISALTGMGVEQLRGQLATAIQNKQMAAKRLEADVTQVARKLSTEIGHADPNEVSKAREAQLNKALGEAAGVGVVTEAVLKATRRRGTLATGWPAITWIKRFKPDPLKRLHLDAVKIGRKAELEPARIQRTGVNKKGFSFNGVQQARVDSAVRGVADEASVGLPRGWQDAVRTASMRDDQVLADELDRAIATTDLAMDRGIGWWKIFQVLQWLLIACVVVGLGWLGARMALIYFGVMDLSLGPTWYGLPIPTWLVAGGVVAGLVLAAVSRVLVEFAAQRKAARATHVLEKSIGQVSRERIINPINAELRRYEQARDSVARAL
ncbi:YfjP family GTPase [Luteococcus sp. H138]|uniref:YfjP family GTPase n=1 Tax=unclassified Luteococcus TaxID=2639923 RepID=UPI00313BDB00